MSEGIEAVGVVGAGTMGSGIAALCAGAGLPVTLLDVSREAAEKAIARLCEGRAPVLDDPKAAARIRPGAIDQDLGTLADADWICEAIIEDRDAKRSLFERLEPVRKDGSIVSTNTSGILLSSLTEGMPERLRHDLAVTHFFNPVKVMKLVEVVPGLETRPEVVRTLSEFLTGPLGKGVVVGKDTVNFVANRIGCFWMLAIFHEGTRARQEGLTIEYMDALLHKAFGIPPTGLYGLVDLIGLDVMGYVAKNLAENLPAGDPGLAYASLPEAEQRMVEAGQLGRKTGGGFYRVQKQADGSRVKEVYDLEAATWRAAEEPVLPREHADAATVMFLDDPAGHFAWRVMGATLAYAADLVPEIADDIVNVDRALRWGFNWEKGPFELLDLIGAEQVAERLEDEGRPVPRMIETLREAGTATFYRAEGGAYLGTDGRFHVVD
jgi:3-hydroxyacyl-CoA dehydrogenase